MQTDNVAIAICAMCPLKTKVEKEPAQWSFGCLIPHLVWSYRQDKMAPITTCLNSVFRVGLGAMIPQHDNSGA